VFGLAQRPERRNNQAHAAQLVLLFDALCAAIAVQGDQVEYVKWLNTTVRNENVGITDGQAHALLGTPDA